MLLGLRFAVSSPGFPCGAPFGEDNGFLLALLPASPDG